MSRSTHLKIKIKTLAAEARIIRLDERKVLKHGRKLGSGVHTSERSCLEGYDAHYRAYKDLYDHRVGIVRSVARENLIAYGYLRGRTISQMESLNSDPAKFPETSKILTVAKNFFTGSAEEKQALVTKITNDLADWKKALMANQPKLEQSRAKTRRDRRVARAAKVA